MSGAIVTMIYKFETLLPKLRQTTDVNWINKFNITEQSLGISLPNDYKTFLLTYGRVNIDDFFLILEPESSNKNYDLTTFKTKKDPVFEEMKKNNPDRIPHVLFPYEGGLLPWAKTSNGDTIFWKVSSESDQWETVVYASGFDSHQCFNMSATEFLHNLLTKKVICSIFPEDFPTPI